MNDNRVKESWIEWTIEVIEWCSEITINWMNDKVNEWVSEWFIKWMNDNRVNESRIEWMM